MKHSTSIYNLNADKGLRKSQKVLYLLLNWVNNSWFPNKAEKNLIIRNFVADISEEDWNQLHVKSSPARKLSELFWLKLPWHLIQEELVQISALDTGCGSGNYGVILKSFSSNRIHTYTGIDIDRHDNWNILVEKHENFQLHQLDNIRILDCIQKGTNFFITQSAIEHFDADLSFFVQVREFIARANSNVIQVHLFPSSAYLKLSLFHGIRQYTPRTISKITRIFKDFSYSVLFRLGGKKCNLLHWQFITKPLLIQKSSDRRETATSEYNKRLMSAIRADMREPQKYPSFYALVIHSNWKEKIFLRNPFE